MKGRIRSGIGGWTFEPWRGVFYPEGLTQKKELAFASRELNTIEINGTFYSTFKPDSWRKWRDETPDDFVFAVKGSRYCTNRKVLAEAGPSVDKFLRQGLTELGAKLGPINWQLAATKVFNPEDIAAFLALLPRKRDGVELRHAIEVRHPSFACEEFAAIARKAGVGIVYAEGKDFPTIDERTAPFTYARIMTSREEVHQGLTDRELKSLVDKSRKWSALGDVFVFFISGAKVRNPAAAKKFLALTSVKPKSRPRDSAKG
ncbi:MAG: DUF72 domain-containing protein [Proteobacteria bacterium]|nr:DUF72 domain-containing protein [Pseudomonadota bacterium]